MRRYIHGRMPYARIWPNDDGGGDAQMKLTSSAQGFDGGTRSIFTGDSTDASARFVDLWLLSRSANLLQSHGSTYGYIAQALHSGTGWHFDSCTPVQSSEASMHVYGSALRHVKECSGAHMAARASRSSTRSKLLRLARSGLKEKRIGSSRLLSEDDAVRGACPTWKLVWLTLNRANQYEHSYVPRQILSRVTFSRTEQFDPRKLHAELVVQPREYNCSVLVVRTHPNYRAFKPTRRGSNATAVAAVVEAYKRAGLVFAIFAIGDEDLPHSCGGAPCTSQDRAAEATSRPHCAFGGEFRYTRAECECMTRDGLTRLYAAAPLVLKNCFDTDCTRHSHVLTVPLGVASGVLHSQEERRAPRKFLWSFASFKANPSRSQMLRAVLSRATLRPAAHAYPGKIHNYTATLCASALALCPSGGHVDTWRLHEALECGALPIVDNLAYFEQYIPISVTRHWIAFDWATDPARPPHQYLRKGHYGVVRWENNNEWVAPHEATKATLDQIERLAANGGERLEARRQRLVEAYEEWQNAVKAEAARRLQLLAGG